MKQNLISAETRHRDRALFDWLRKYWLTNYWRLKISEKSYFVGSASTVCQQYHCFCTTAFISFFTVARDTSQPPVQWRWNSCSIPAGIWFLYMKRVKWNWRFLQHICTVKWGTLKCVMSVKLKSHKVEHNCSMFLFWTHTIHKRSIISYMSAWVFILLLAGICGIWLRVQIMIPYALVRESNRRQSCSCRI